MNSYSFLFLKCTNTFLSTVSELNGIFVTEKKEKIFFHASIMNFRFSIVCKCFLTSLCSSNITTLVWLYEKERTDHPAIQKFCFKLLKFIAIICREKMIIFHLKMNVFWCLYHWKFYINENERIYNLHQTSETNLISILICIITFKFYLWKFVLVTYISYLKSMLKSASPCSF